MGLFSKKGGSKSYVDKGQSGYLKDLYQRAEDQYYSGTPTYYPDKTQAALTPSQWDAYRQSQALSGDYSRMGDQLFGIGQDLSGYYDKAFANAGYQDYVSPEYQADYSLLDAYENPYLNDQIQAEADLAYRNLDENILTGIRGQAAQYGGSTSSRKALQEGVATRDVEDKIQDYADQARISDYEQRAGMMDAAARQNLNAQLQQQALTENERQARQNLFESLGSIGFDTLGQSQAYGLGGIEQLLKSGSDMEQYQQRLLDEAKARYDFGQMAPYQALQDYQRQIGPHIKLGGSEGQAPSTAGQLTQMGLTALGAYQAGKTPGQNMEHSWFANPDGSSNWAGDALSWINYNAPWGAGWGS